MENNPFEWAGIVSDGDGAGFDVGYGMCEFHIFFYKNVTVDNITYPYMHFEEEQGVFRFYNEPPSNNLDHNIVAKMEVVPTTTKFCWTSRLVNDDR